MYDRRTTLVRLARLGEAVRLSEAMAEADRAARDLAVFEAHAVGGLSVRQIARVTGMSVTRTQEVVIRQTALHQARTLAAMGLED